MSYLTRRTLLPIGSAVALAVVALAAAAPAPSARSHYYQVDYKKAGAGGVAELHLTAHDGAADRAKVAKLLRRHFEAAVEIDPPAADVVAAAWTAGGDMIGEQLIYRAKDRKILPASEAFRKK